MEPERKVVATLMCFAIYEENNEVSEDLKHVGYNARAIHSAIVKNVQVSL